MLLGTEVVLGLLGPVFALLVLSFGFLQIYPRFFESIAERRGYGAELTRRRFSFVLLILKLEITSVSIAAVFILLYPLTEALQHRCWVPSWSDELLLVAILTLLSLAVSFIIWGTWKVSVKELSDVTWRR
jgi:hypothetical protein